MNRVKLWNTTMRQNWREAQVHEHFSKLFVVNFALCFAVFMLIVQWLKYNSTRHGLLINDPVYPLLAPRDYSNIIFFFTYTATVSTILYLIAHPHKLHRGFTGFVVLFAIRALCIFLIPLAPSGDLVTLRDPFTNFMANEQTITNDLFFSGHVADVAFFYFLVEGKWLKRYLFVCAVGVATLLVLQHVHYTLDVLAAPFFSYFCYWAVVEKDFIWSPFLKKSEDAKNAHQTVAE